MEAPGLACWLLVLLVVRAAAQQCLDQRHHDRSVKEGGGHTEKARAYTMEWRMEAVAHVASLSIRNQQCKTDPSNCDLQEGATAPISLLAEWAVHNSGWERLLSSASLYEIARQAYQAGDYDEAIIALEEALALRLFPYLDSSSLDRWQQGLMLPGGLFRRQKMDLANILVLRSDCLVQLAQAQQDIEDISEAMELLQLATALLKAGNELVPDSLAALQHRAQTLATVAMKILPQLRTQRIVDHLQGYGLSCPSCRSQMDYLAQMVPLLRIPLRVTQGRLEVITDPFRTQMGALLRQPHEGVGPYMQRVFFRLLAMVPSDYLADLKVPCRKLDAKGRCMSYLPSWVTATGVVLDGGHQGMGRLAHPPGVPCGAPGQPVCAWGSFDVGASGPSMAGPLGGFDANSGQSVAGGRCTDQLCGSLSGAAAAAAAPSSQAAASGAGSGDAPHGSSTTSGGGSSGASKDSSSSSGRKRSRGRRSSSSGSAGTAGSSSSSSSSAAGGFTPDGSVALAGSQLCGFLHVRAIPPGVDLPASGGNLTPEQQRLLQRKAQGGEQPPSSAATPFQGVYYYYYADIPALIDRVVNTFDQEESEYLFAQLDGLTGVHWLLGGGKGRRIAQGHLTCTETDLLEGRAPSGCSVLVPNFGSCATTPLKPPRRRIPLPPPPPGLGVPPPRSSYTPKYRQRMPADFQWDRAGGYEQNGSGGPRGVPAGQPRGVEPGVQQANQAAAWDRLYFPASDRELSDKQLQEQLLRMSRDAGRKDRDDPLIPITLAGCVVASCCLYFASRRRRSFVSWSWRTKGSNTTTFNSSVGSERGVSSSGDGSAPGSQLSASLLRRQAAAALRDAMAGGDVVKLEAAVAEAELLELDAALIQRARVTLSQRKKRERERAQAAAAKARALRKEQTRRQKQAAAAAAAAAAEAAAKAAAAAGGDGARGGGAGGSGRGGGPLQRLVRWWMCGAGSMPLNEDSSTAQAGPGSAAGEPSSPTSAVASGGNSCSSLCLDTITTRDSNSNRQQWGGSSPGRGAGAAAAAAAEGLLGMGGAGGAAAHTSPGSSSSSSPVRRRGSMLRTPSSATDASAVVHVLEGYGDLVGSSSSDGGSNSAPGLTPSCHTTRSSRSGSTTTSSSASSSRRSSSSCGGSGDVRNPVSPVPPPAAAGGGAGGTAANPAAAQPPAPRPAVAAAANAGSYKQKGIKSSAAAASAPPRSSSAGARAAPGKQPAAAATPTTVAAHKAQSAKTATTTTTTSSSSMSSGAQGVQPAAAGRPGVTTLGSTPAAATAAAAARGAPGRCTAPGVTPPAAAAGLSQVARAAPPTGPCAAAAPGAGNATSATGASTWLGWLSPGATTSSTSSPAAARSSPLAGLLGSPATAAAGGAGGGGGARKVARAIIPSSSSWAGGEQGTPSRPGKLNPSAAPFQPPPVTTATSAAAQQQQQQASGAGGASSPPAVVLPDSLYPSSNSPDSKPAMPRPGMLPSPALQAMLPPHLTMGAGHHVSPGGTAAGAAYHSQPSPGLLAGPGSVPPVSAAGAGGWSGLRSGPDYSLVYSPQTGLTPLGLPPPSQQLLSGVEGPLGGLSHPPPSALPPTLMGPLGSGGLAQGRGSSSNGSEGFGFSLFASAGLPSTAAPSSDLAPCLSASSGCSFLPTAAVGVTSTTSSTPGTVGLSALERLPSYLAQLSQGTPGGGGGSTGGGASGGGGTHPLLGQPQQLVGMFGASPHVWAPPRATTAMATLPVTGVSRSSSLWAVPSDNSSSPLGGPLSAASGSAGGAGEGRVTGGFLSHSLGDVGYPGGSLDLPEVEVAAAALSQGMAEHVLGSSPSPLVSAEADMLQLAQKMMSQVMD